MIKTQNLVPQVYYDKSRDFQLLGRTFDIVFNYLKTNIDLIYNNPLSDNSDERLVDLLALTLGFKSRHNYNVKQLTAMCSSFMLAMRNKGNITGIELAVNTLIQAEGIKNGALILVDSKNNNLNIYIPVELTDINLLNDLLVYILPAGMSCSIIRQQLVETSALTEGAVGSQIVYLHNKTSDLLGVIGQYSEAEKDASGIEGHAFDNMVVPSYVAPEDSDNEDLLSDE